MKKDCIGHDPGCAVDRAARLDLQGCAILKLIGILQGYANIILSDRGKNVRRRVCACGRCKVFFKVPNMSVQAIGGGVYDL